MIKKLIIIVIVLFLCLLLLAGAGLLFLKFLPGAATPPPLSTVVPIDSKLVIKFENNDITPSQSRVHANVDVPLEITGDKNKHACQLMLSDKVIPLQVNGSAVESITVDANASAAATIPSLARGSYILQCDLPGHKLVLSEIIAE